MWRFVKMKWKCGWKWWKIHYEKMGWFATSLANEFLSCKQFTTTQRSEQITWVTIDSTHCVWNCIHMQLMQFNDNCCRNLSFGLTTKAKVSKGAGQEWSPIVTFHAPKSVGKCEGMNPHTPKWAPTLGVGVPMESRWIPKSSGGNCRVKTHWIEEFLTSLESSWNLDV
jgi:hypothetical protein